MNVKEQTNSNLHVSRAGKTDEFYTDISMIENELRHYREYFKNKVVFCNCDDPAISNFWKYFQINFYMLGLKKLISTHYESDKPSYKLEIIRQDDKIGQLAFLPDYVETPLTGDGDFRSPEAIQLLKEARLSKGLTREQVGSMIQIAPRYLTNIENKGQQPSFHVVYDLVTLLNISLDGFILGEENSHKSSKRLQVEAQLDCLDEDELVTIGKVIQAIYGEKCKFN